jgi:thiosulfate dehydrogenase
MRFLLGLIFGILIVPAALFVYFQLGHPPVAVADQPFLHEREIVGALLHARIDKEMAENPPIEASETNLEVGAHIYRQQCAACHGLYGRPSDFAKHMYPNAPQLWSPHGDGVVGVSDDPPGETYWKIANGIRLTGMPAFDQILNKTQMWQVTLLLANADKPLPASALHLLKQPLNLDPAPVAATQQPSDQPQNAPDPKLSAAPAPLPADQTKPDGK